ncbi:hypothetical protein QBC47DRAFT_299526 [Echria macrotheca]|uniref:Uncharacterized protein n=1 Tax=Echria macrotheca TaxID=438768 RepID=A0AAJ0F6S7_9PEZI|nr:hypothetical protein QBC47DRAFT_299526 [Echria macrotheca]
MTHAARRVFSAATASVGSEDEEPTGSDVDSNWSKYGDIPDILDEYDRALALVDGSESWNLEQRKVHQLIYMRGAHPMIPSIWKMGLKLWGLDQPQLDHIFTPVGSQKRVVISSSSDNEVPAVKALESLFILSQRVNDYEETGEQHLMEPFIVKTISQYIKWSLQDAQIHEATPPLVLVKGYPPDSRIPDEASEMSVDHDTDDSSEDEGNVDDTDKKATERFIRFLTGSLNRKLRNMGQVWRDLLWDPNYRRPGESTATGRYLAEPPTLYAFAVVQHKVMVVSHDSSQPDNPIVSIDSISLNDRGMWLWNALSIAIPINVAKTRTRKLQGLLVRKGLLSEVSTSSDDPDL